ncbi:MAG: PQQ-binding-like beta-propeller repeat protein, partial [Thermoplasmata archaeon]|nr:PQQ-binding-like beta-propeller repeat protein [Thermoplasmata archaeon]
SGWVYLAQPTVHEGIVYIGTDNGSLHAVSLEDGTELWASELGGRLRGTPLVHGGSIYLIKGIYDGFIPKDGFLLALDMDGNERWEVNIGTTGSSPAMIDDTVVVGSTGGLRAFGTDGTPEWSFTEGGPVSSSPAITAGRIHFMTNVNDSDEGLHTTIFSVSSNGYEDWRKELRPHNWALSSVAIADGRIYAATDAGWVYSLGDTPFHADYEWTADGGHVTLNDSSVSFGAELVGWRWQNSEFEELRDQNVTVQFNASGIYPVTLLVYDEFGRKVRVTKNVTVELPPLVAGSTYVVDGTMVTFTANDTDPDLIVTEYRWDIDGVAEPLIGKEVTHEFEEDGKYDVTLVISDEYDRQETVTQTIKIEKEETDDGGFEYITQVLILIGIILVIAIIVIFLPPRGKGKE